MSRSEISARAMLREAGRAWALMQLFLEAAQDFMSSEDLRFILDDSRIDRRSAMRRLVEEGSKHLYLSTTGSRTIIVDGQQIYIVLVHVSRGVSTLEKLLARQGKRMLTEEENGALREEMKLGPTTPYWVPSTERSGYFRRGDSYGMKLDREDQFSASLGPMGLLLATDLPREKS